MISSPANNINIAVIGFGWLAQSLKSYWSSSKQTFTPLFFSRTHSPGLTQLELSPQTTTLPEELKEADVIFYTLPPTNDSLSYKETVKTFGSLLPKNSRVILISSTSVYESNRDLCVEETVPLVSSDRAKNLLSAEEVFRSRFPRGCIIRSGGQYGAGRYPAKFLAQKDLLKNSLQPVNVIHQWDLVRICTLAITDVSLSLINAVSPLHLSKEDFYARQASELGLTLPPGDNKGENGKIVNSRVLKEGGFVFEKKNSIL